MRCKIFSLITFLQLQYSHTQSSTFFSNKLIFPDDDDEVDDDDLMAELGDILGDDDEDMLAEIAVSSHL